MQERACTVTHTQISYRSRIYNDNRMRNKSYKYQIYTTRTIHKYYKYFT